jgi:hypothetical protein
VDILTILTATPTVPAKLAQECLSSVPLAKDAALALVDAMEPYLEWQSGELYSTTFEPIYEDVLRRAT